ncbi:LysR substrate-binding domain-containing protein [Aurantimonas sp. MSK8Z-1]|uniref:LysR substrate-binding domain-containing protein n=1 Tax=Mangrovibrevibacter kandeliae TaxID=2968473 RepID=UPI00222F1995|nr:LysR substrate-binding domain-containing protein [Aurantimonas sp. MSK8Z-1]MCW4115932.1 LysR substrate-binding domain-containing protein [Aurantimonas sp. MSK8Z-1]
MITIRQMRYFEVLAEALHFGRAARRLNISQPALSAQIAQMEAFFGTTLFERRSNGLIATAEGAALGERIRRILTEVRDLEALAARPALLQSRLKIGVIASVAPYLLPTLLPAAAERHPQLELEVRESVTAALIDGLEAGELDCVVLALPVEQAGLDHIELAVDRFHLAVPEAAQARFGTPVPLARLKDEKLILLEEGHCLRDQALKVCEIAGAGRLASFGATSLTTILRMVAGGLGITLIPELAVGSERMAGGIAFLPLAEPAPSRTLALSFRRSAARRADFEALADLLRDSLAPVRADTD